MLASDLVAGASGAAAFTGLTRPQIYALVRQGQLPVVRKGRMLFFRKSELEAAFSSRAAS